MAYQASVLVEFRRPSDQQLICPLPRGRYGYVTHLPCPTSHRSSSNEEHIFCARRESQGDDTYVSQPLTYAESDVKALRAYPSPKRNSDYLDYPLAQRNRQEGYVTRKDQNDP